jgi:hypothetical protein
MPYPGSLDAGEVASQSLQRGTLSVDFAGRAEAHPALVDARRAIERCLECLLRFFDLLHRPCFAQRDQPYWEPSLAPNLGWAGPLNA